MNKLFLGTLTFQRRFSIMAIVGGLVILLSLGFAAISVVAQEEITLEANWERTSNAGPGQYYMRPQYNIDDSYWTWTDNVWDRVSPMGHPYVYWSQPYYTTYFWFRAEVFVPEGATTITMLNPYEPRLHTNKRQFLCLCE